jgi:hypothetical protein
LQTFASGPVHGNVLCEQGVRLFIFLRAGGGIEGKRGSVTTLCPGMTHSEFHARANLKRSAALPMMSAEVMPKNRLSHHDERQANRRRKHRENDADTPGHSDRGKNKSVRGNNEEAFRTFKLDGCMAHAEHFRA